MNIEKKDNTLSVTDADLEARAQAFMQETLDMYGTAGNFREGERHISNMGSDKIKRASYLAGDSSIMGRIRKTKENEDVTGGLLELRDTVEHLNPNRRRTVLERFQKVPLVGGLVKRGHRAIMEGQSVEEHLDKIRERLIDSSESLIMDNAHINEHVNDFHQSNVELGRQIELAKIVEHKINEEIKRHASNPEMVQAMNDQLLKPLLQRLTDLQVQVQVNNQSIQALGIVYDNNKTLIAQVKRSATTTIAALQSAMIVSQATAGQTNTLQTVNSVNRTTERLMIQSAQQLGRNAREIAKMEQSATLDPAKLQLVQQEIEKTLRDVQAIGARQIESLKQASVQLDQANERSRKAMEMNRKVQELSSGNFASAEDAVQNEEAKAQNSLDA